MSDDKAHVLYRFFSATGQLLYIGITMNPPQRFKSHRDTKEWWDMVSGITVESYSNRDELAAAERRAIQVEHPLHNIVHTKAKHRSDRQAPQPSPLPEPEPTPLFPQPEPAYTLSSLFSGSKYRDTRYGYMTEEDYERRAEAERAKQQARFDCPMCSPIGYRPNGYVCDHIDHSESRLAKAQRKVQKERLQVVRGGGV